MLVLIACWMCGQKAGSSQSAAQESGDAPEQRQAGQIAVVDITRLITEHPGFKKRMETIRKQLDEFKKQVTVRQAEIESVQRKLQQLKPGSKEHDDTLLLVSRLQTELKLANARGQHGIMKQEAALYGDTYGEIAEAIGEYAKANGIRLVLRAHHAPIDPDNHKSVMAAINRQVVYQERLDITGHILKELNAPKGDKSAT
jgi:Skp family chaperone for outer membrane proteins